jgi:hypothetical protein
VEETIGYEALFSAEEWDSLDLAEWDEEVDAPHAVSITHDATSRQPVTSSSAGPAGRSGPPTTRRWRRSSPACTRTSSPSSSIVGAKGDDPLQARDPCVGDTGRQRR